MVLGAWLWVYLLALPAGQVTLAQHEAKGAHVGVAPGSDQPHVLLEQTHHSIRDGKDSLVLLEY